MLLNKLWRKFLKVRSHDLKLSDSSTKEEVIFPKMILEFPNWTKVGPVRFENYVISFLFPSPKLRNIHCMWNNKITNLAIGHKTFASKGLSSHSIQDKHTQNFRQVHSHNKIYFYNFT